MDSNTHSTQPPGLIDDDLELLAAAARRVAARNLAQLPGSVRAGRVQTLRRLLDGLEGQWLKELASVDALGAAATDPQAPAPSTASWLRNRLRMSAGTAHDTVGTARALFRGPLPQTAAALTDGVISPAHARVLAQGTRHLPDHLTRDAEPVLVEAARRLDPPKLRQAIGYLVEVADPEGADAARQRRHERRGVWLSPTWQGMVAINGLLEAEAGATVLAALEPLARPADAADDRSGSQRHADALAELARRSLEGGWLPKAGGVRPQLLVTVDLDSLLGRPGSFGGDLGWAGPVDREACRRLGCDGAVTRVLVTRQPTTHDPNGDRGADHGLGTGPDPDADHDPGELPGLLERLRAALTLLPPTLGGAPSQPLDVGRATRVVQPAQRAALAVRDRGCVFPGCDRPLAWCEGHHLWHWADGGPTDLGNLALLCRAHHRAVHEGGWQLTRGPDGRFTASPGHRRHHVARPHAPATPDPPCQLSPWRPNDRATVGHHFLDADA
jgi:hypothetical protein